MKLDCKAIRYLSKDDWRTLVAVEMGMKNHEYVPVSLICNIANLRYGGGKKSINNIHKFKLLFHDARKYDGYKLTYLGYDYLGLKALVSRDIISFVGNQIGVGKESDIYVVANDKNEEMILKLHRLGRVSFKTIKNNRDYLQHRKSASWLYLSRLSALKEFAYMKALYDNGFPVPQPIDCNRHCIVMTRVKGYPLTQIVELRHPRKVYSDLMNLIVRLANYGLIHGDFNEFNIMISDDEEITLIDFPQMVSTSHLNAEYYFDRDVNCIRSYFEKRFNFIGEQYPKFSDYKQSLYNLDVLISASGFTKDLQKDMDDLTKEQDDDDENEENSGDEQTSTTNENESKDNKDNEDEDDDEEEEEDEEDDDEEDDEDVDEEEEEDEKVDNGQMKKKDDGVKEITKNMKGLVNNNRNFKFSDVNEYEPAPIVLRKEFIDEMNVLENVQAEPVVEEDVILDEEALEAERKREQQVRIANRVKKQLTKSQKTRVSARNTAKSRSRTEVKNHINAFI
ncbi:putative protein serine/threonine kinase [Heterostelium album PN500]|uniref:Serine/threonine-protein kinase RIO2 n=1 Tax=Heterostelium pallidum (strain ATCC 26659 / Pp 5 / PN500) TaxID=670386 RepID=D3BDY0_HETP5|nr:putative protein serine/threonine kinase [Heterostelium album PN500]EFA80111.1 putative protein serine/threonine kinase [Heterostelium album PN500]|eukprot:XP_020432231.1 putative protein serine/threonine kinase [Heterostelium album PN500]